MVHSRFLKESIYRFKVVRVSRLEKNIKTCGDSDFIVTGLHMKRQLENPESKLGETLFPEIYLLCVVTGALVVGDYGSR